MAIGMASHRTITRWSRLLGLLVMGAYLLHYTYYAAQINDDAFITFRYSRMLAEGHGPYFNHGEHVEGYTNFLLMLVMAAWIRVFGPDDVLTAAKFLGMLGGVGTLWCTQRLCAAWLRRVLSVRDVAEPLAWLAPALLAVNSAFAVNSTTGLETTLFAFWITLGLWLVQRARDQRRWCGAGLAFAAAVLTRPEGAWVFAAVFLARIITADWADRQRRMALGIDWLVVVATAGVHLLFRMLMYDGELLPNTYYAKQGGFLGGGTPTAYVWSFVRFHLGGPLVLLSLLPLLAHKRGLRLAVVPALLLAADGVLAIYLAGPDWMLGYRLLVPYVPVVAALSIAGIAVVADLLAARPRFVAAAAGALLPAVLLWWQAGARASLQEHVAMRAAGYLRGHTAAAHWIRGRAAPGDTIALMDIGIIGYVCIEQNVLDITGLTDRTIAKSPGGFLDKRVDPAYVYDRRPAFFVAVLTAPDPDGGEPDPTYLLDNLHTLGHWTGIEATLLDAPEFARHYFRLREPDEDAHPLDQLAARVGAAKVFLHDHPRLYYLLAVYTRENAE